MSVKILPSRSRGPNSGVINNPWRPYSPSPASSAYGMASARVVHRGDRLIAEVADVLGDRQQHDRVERVAEPGRRARQRRRGGAGELVIHRLADHDHVRRALGQVVRLAAAGLHREAFGVDPPFVERGDPDQVGADDLGDVLDVVGGRLGRVELDPLGGTVAQHRQWIEEAVAVDRRPRTSRRRCPSRATTRCGGRSRAG